MDQPYAWFFSWLGTPAKSLVGRQQTLSMWLASMSREKARQTSRDRLAANLFVAILASPVFFLIWLNQKSKATPPAVDGYGPPEFPL